MEGVRVGVLLAALSSSFLITFFVTPLCIRLARYLNFLDVPDGTIKLQKTGVPYLGGLAIFLGVFFSLLATNVLQLLPVSIFIGLFLLLLLGLGDDIFVLTPQQKFLGQLIAVSFFITAEFYLKTEFASSWWRLPLSMLWMLTIINATNLVDIMDGLASCIALGILIPYLAIAILFDQQVLMQMVASFVGAIAAFLYYNKPQALIYLGDSGSLFLGGALAIVPFLLSWGAHTAYGMVIPFIIAALLLLEVVGLVIIRLYKGIPFYKASPDHFKNYLQKNNWHCSKILCWTLFLSTITGITSIIFTLNHVSFWQIIVLGMLYIIVWVRAVFLC